MSYLNQSSASDRKYDILYFSLYISMLTSSDETKTRIGHILEEIFNGKYQLDQIIEIINDIKSFFIKFSKELSMRFEKREILQLKEKNNPVFYSFHENDLDNVWQGQKTEFKKMMMRIGC